MTFYMKSFKDVSNLIKIIMERSEGPIISQAMERIDRILEARNFSRAGAKSINDLEDDLPVIKRNVWLTASGHVANCIIPRLEEAIAERREKVYEGFDRSKFEKK